MMSNGHQKKRRLMFLKNFRVIIILLFGLIMLGVDLSWAQNCPSNWENTNNWSARRKITFQNVPSTLNDFPVLVILDRERIDYNKADGEGDDLRFFDANGSPLSYEIEQYNSAGASYIWVKIPQIDSGSGDYFWMYHNNPNASDGQQPTQVWTNEYVNVYHLSDGFGPPLFWGNEVKDSGPNGLQADGLFDAIRGVTAKIAGGFSMGYENAEQSTRNEGKSMNCLDSKLGYSHFAPRRLGCYNIWMKPEFDTQNLSPTNNKYYLMGIYEDIRDADGNATGPNCSIDIDWHAEEGELEIFMGCTDAENILSVPASKNILKDEWHHVALCWDQENALIAKFYLNGEQVSLGLSNGNDVLDFQIPVASTFPAGGAANRWSFGSTYYCNPETGHANGWVGLIDEVRWSKTMRSDAWIKAQYLSQNDELLFFGQEENCGSPVNPPAAPSNLSATAASQSQIDLSWTDNSNNESGFKIERGSGSTPNSWTEISTVGAGVTVYSNSGLSASTTYSYRVRAYNGAGNSNYTTQATATTSDPPSNPPNAPSNLNANSQSSSRIDLLWSDNSNDEDGFKIERGNGSNPSSWNEIVTVGAGVSSYFNTGLIASTTYSYRVRAYNSAGNSGYSNVSTATTQSTGGTGGILNCSNVSGISAASGENYICAQLNDGNPGDEYYIDRNYTLSTVPSYLDGTAWIMTANDDKQETTNSFLSFNTTQNVTVYVALDDRATSPPNWLSSWTLSNDIVKTSLQDYVLYFNDFSAGAITLGANSASGSSWPTTNLKSNYVVAIVEDVPQMPPAAPSNLSATAASQSQIDLSWSDNSGDEDGFKIERGDGSNPNNWSEIATVGPNVPFYSNTGLSASTTYSYRVRAYNSVGNSGYTNPPATATTQSPPTNQPPIVNPITHDAIDVDPIKPGLQVEEGTTVTYSSSVSDPDNDPVNWNWLYTENGGSEIPMFGGINPPTQVQDMIFTYNIGTAGKIYTWIIRGSDGQATTEQTLDVEIVSQSTGGQTPSAPFVTKACQISLATASGRLGCRCGSTRVS